MKLTKLIYCHPERTRKILFGQAPKSRAARPTFGERRGEDPSRALKMTRFSALPFFRLASGAV
jgi:hypothetical protein